jgi:hypothetical protein
VGILLVHGLVFYLGLGRCTVIGVVRCTFSFWSCIVAHMQQQHAANDCLIWLGCQGWEEGAV